MESTDFSKRLIAKNSVFLFFRSIVMMLIGLYASRVLLGKLGIEDFGIYNIVGGVVLMFNSLRSLFSNAIQRFLNYARGLGVERRLNQVFVTGLQVQVILSVFFLVLAETVGLYAFLHLNIPEGRSYAAAVVYQITIATAVVSMVTLPYDALVISNERMSVYAWMSIMEKVLFLGIIYLIDIGPLDHLINYAILMFVVTLLMRVVTISYCIRQFGESKLNRVSDRSLLKEMGQFAGWNFLGRTGLYVTHEGVNYILNLYGGVVVNAARSIAYQVMKGTNMLVNNVNMAFKPQTNASAAQADKRLFHQLLGYNGKTAFICYLLVTVPILIFSRQIIGLWLGQVPDYVISFVFAVSGFHLLRSLHELVNQFFISIGEMRDYQIVEICAMMLNIPLAICLLSNGYPFWTVFVGMTVVEAVNHALTVWLAVRKYQFPLWGFMKGVYLPFVIMTVLSMGIVGGGFLVGMNDTGSLIGGLLWSVAIVGALLAASYVFVLNGEDRRKVMGLIESRLWRRAR